ncbi:CBD9-like protein [Microthyrium microscopicum]|uniref:CBD9-like protein n=1 Tax=Microthyrium microscopicum TaxID=703497 RepID=A0A6A6UHZ9_9PEZI|nr:CBD9-like protein [Microthyrium microscopicum]
MKILLLSVLLGSAYGAVNKKCPASNICSSISIPDSAASSGKSDVFLQITGPTSYSWVSVGTGTGMSGSTMFVIYTSSSGNNITLSTRKGSGHSTPEYDSSVKATLIDGSGVSNGVMTANIRCSSCSTSQSNWIFGAYQGSALNSDSPAASIRKHQTTYGTFTFDLSQAKGGASTNPFAERGSSSGSSGGNTSPTPVDGCGNRANNDPSATTGNGAGNGAGSGAGNGAGSGSASDSSSPVGSGSSTGSTSASGPNIGGNGEAGGVPSHGHGPPWGNGPPPWVKGPPHGPPWLRPTSPPQVTKRQATNSCQPGSNNNGNSNSNSGGNGNSGTGTSSNGSSNNGNINKDVSTGASTTNRLGYTKEQSKLLAHGLLAGFSFAVFFPLGATAIRLFSFAGLVAVHGYFQVFTMIVFTIAFALGVTIAEDLAYMRDPHIVLGILVFTLLWIQPILGYMHHRMFRQEQKRTLWSYGHIWLGRTMITLGIINGGLGFLLAQNTTKGARGYGVVAGAHWLIWIISIFIGEKRRARLQQGDKQSRGRG